MERKTDKNIKHRTPNRESTGIFLSTQIWYLISLPAKEERYKFHGDDKRRIYRFCVLNDERIHISVVHLLEE